MKKQYGMERTHLQLEGLALRAYGQTDPMDIYEIVDGDSFVYTMTGSDDLLTEQDVIDNLLSYLTFRIKPEYLDDWGATEDTAEIDWYGIKDLAIQWGKTPEELVEQTEIL